MQPSTTSSTTQRRQRPSRIDLSKPIVYSSEIVGLGTQRPFRFCTMHCNCGIPEPVLIRPGDNPEASGQECIEIFIPNNLRPQRPEKSTFKIHDSSTIYVEEDPGYDYTPAHRHEFYEIALVRGGSANHHTLDGVYALQRGDVIVVTPSGVHGYERNDQLLYTDLYLQPEWLFDDLRLLWSEEGLIRTLLADALFRRTRTKGVLQFRCQEQEVVAWERELRDLEREAQKNKPSLACYNGCFLKILSMLNEAFLRSEQIVHFPYRSDIWAAAGIIEEWATQGSEFNLALLAKQVDMSAPYFSRIFRENTGWTPTDYYQNRRIQHAATMIQDSNLSITEVAHRLNFADGSHFSRTFRKFRGLSPQAFRAQCNARRIAIRTDQAG